MTVREETDTKRWTMPAFCWLIVFYLMLIEHPEITLSVYAAAGDVFPELTFVERDKMIRGLIDRDPEAWEKVLGKAEDPIVERILESLSRWETPDVAGLYLGPFSNLWHSPGSARSIDKPE